MIIYSLDNKLLRDRRDTVNDSGISWLPLSKKVCHRYDRRQTLFMTATQ